MGSWTIGSPWVGSPTLGAGEASGLAIDLLAVLATAGAVAVGFGRLRLSAIPGYLVAGALLGPGLLGVVTDGERIDDIANLAVVLLMFGIGLHLDSRALGRGAVSLLTAGIGSTLTTAAVATPIAMLFGLRAPAAIAVGMAVAMSSTAVVLRIVQERRALSRGYGRLCFGVLLVQDLLVIGAMALLPLLASWSARIGGAVAEVGRTDPGGLGDMFAAGALRVGVVGGLLVVGRFVLPRAMLWVTRHVSSEVVLVVAAAVALGSAVACGAVGLSPELGAFIAGFVLASTPLKYQLSGQMTPLRDLFMAVFFTAVGLKLDLLAVGSLWWAVLACVALVLVVKTLSIGLWAWVSGAPKRSAIQGGLSLAQAGEFTLVLLSAAAAEGLVGGDREAVLIATVVVTLMLTPTLMNRAAAWAPGLARALPGGPTPPWIRVPAVTEAPEGSGEERRDSPRRLAVVAGFGPVGRTVADRLSAADMDVTIIELNTSTVRRQQTLGRSIVYGDVTNPEVLESAGVREADAVIFTIPDDEAMLRACRQVRSMNGVAFVAARVGVLSKGMLARELGADHVIVEEIAAADAMAREVLDKLRTRAARDGVHEPEAA